MKRILRKSTKFIIDLIVKPITALVRIHVAILSKVTEVRVQGRAAVKHGSEGSRNTRLLPPLKQKQFPDQTTEQCRRNDMTCDALERSEEAHD